MRGTRQALCSSEGQHVADPHVSQHEQVASLSVFDFRYDNPALAYRERSLVCHAPSSAFAHCTCIHMKLSLSKATD